MDWQGLLADYVIIHLKGDKKKGFWSEDLDAWGYVLVLM
jgi:hypothetical protein